jgi:hypothetical protein
MTYTEVNVVIAGAEFSHNEYATEATLEAAFTSITEAAQRITEHVEVFTIVHAHEQGIECECVQYLQDHHATLEFNAPETETFRACASCCVVIVNGDTTHLENADDGGPGDDETTILASIEAVGPLTHVGIDVDGYFRCFFCGADEIGADLFEGEAR